MSEVQSERKYRIDGASAQGVLEAIAPFTVATIHDPVAPIAWTRTTYLDTPALDYFRSGDGTRSRRLRVREYASAPDLASMPLLTGECWLELKESAACTRVKSRFCAAGEVIAAMIAAGELPPAWEERLAFLDGSRDLLRRIVRDRPAPVLTTWYRRTARAAGAVRVTVDEELSWALPCAIGARGLAAAPPRVFAKLASCVLEVKHAGPAPAWLEDALGGLPAPSDFSKFREGMRRLLQSGAGAEGSVSVS
jgi:hypothetical protein